MHDAYWHNIFMQQMYLFIMLTSYYYRLKLHLPIKNGKKKLTRVSFYLACRPHSLCCAHRLQDAKRWHMQFCFANFKVALLTNCRPEINWRTAASFSVWFVPLQKSPVGNFCGGLQKTTVLLWYNMASLKFSMGECMFCARKCDREAVHGYLGIFLIESCTIQPEWCIKQSHREVFYFYFGLLFLLTGHVLRKL